MATLTNTKIKDTYVGLLKTTDNQAIDASGVTLVEDGAGNASALSVGRSGNGVSVSGNLAVDTNTLYVDAANNQVGIGTSSPSEKVDVNGRVQAERFRTTSAGDAGFAAYYMQGDANTGLFSPAADNIGFTTAGSERMRIDSSGNVLIGTTSTFDANAITMSDNGQVFANNFAVANAAGSVGGTSPNLYSPASATLAISTGGSERMRIDSSGNVGIGSSSPVSKLTLEGARNTNTITLRTTNNDSGWSSGDEFGAIEFYSNDTSGGSVGVMSAISCFTTQTSGSTSELSFSTSEFGARNVERMRILSSGGITFNGDTAADNALDDYEEGTWTPTYTTADGDFDTIDYGTQTGRYTKIGRVVYCDLMLRAGNITYSGAVTAGSDVRISGLPFSVIGGFAIAGGSIAFINNWGNTNNPNSISVQTGTGGIALNKLSDTASRYAVSVSDLDTGAANSRNDIRMSFFYFV